jgi:hypothetical protein
MTMALDETKIALLGRDAADFHQAHATAEETLIRRMANVVGVGLGVKWTGGEPTGQPAVVALVTHKAPLSDLRASDRVPSTIGGVRTDVLAVGHPTAGAQAAAGVTLATRLRPAMGGFSVGHKDITAGTIGTAAYDILPGGSSNPPSTGIGDPSQFYILSNNHVLANGNAGRIGDAILQPGAFDGGVDPQDRIATLSRFIPLDFAPDIPIEEHNNVIDAAVAAVNCSDLDRQLFWIGRLRGWRRKANVNVGTVVQKVGRSSGYTLGRITAIKVTIDIGYGGGRGARLRDQFVTTAMSTPGDSGSLIVTLDGVAVGLLCAGSPTATVANQIENVRALLGVEVAEQVL